MTLADRTSLPAPEDPLPQQRPDEELMQLLKTGQEAPLEVLMSRHGTELIRFFRWRSADPHTALDLANETFYRVFTKAATFDPSKPFRPWLFAVALNVWRAWQRRRRPSEISLDRIPQAVRDPGASGSTRDPGALERLLASLSETDREILLLRHYEGLKLKEIAPRLGLTPGAVYTRLSRALGRLRAGGSPPTSV